MTHAPSIPTDDPASPAFYANNFFGCVAEVEKRVIFAIQVGMVRCGHTAEVLEANTGVQDIKTLMKQERPLTEDEAIRLLGGVEVSLGVVLYVDVKEIPAGLKEQIERAMATSNSGAAIMGEGQEPDPEYQLEHFITQMALASLGNGGRTKQ